MILKGENARKYFAKPDPQKAGILIAGADAMAVALRRQEVIAALIGPDGAAEMRLTRMSGAMLRKDKTVLLDEMKASGFFPGLRVIFVEDATDALAPLFADTLTAWRSGDAVLVATGGALTGKSALKAVFDAAPHAFSAILYDDPMSPAELQDLLRGAGLVRIEPPAMQDLITLAAAIEVGDFRHFVEKLALYKYGDESPLTVKEVAALAPNTLEAEVDDLLHAVAEARVKDIGTLMQRLGGQGVLPVTLCIQAMRHFRALYVAKIDPAGLAKARVFGPRRDHMQRQITQWSAAALEQAIALLLETDLTLRSASRAPTMAVIERSLIRLAMMRR